MAKRYEQLLPLIRQYRPTHIVEVGVHRAMRAVAMSREALALNPTVHYTGFDVFETMGAQFQEDALNGKGMTTRAAAVERLSRLQREFPKFTYKLVIGDTRDTLRGRTVIAEFAFIDGDHRVPAIRSDYAALANCRCVVFDDYYVPGADGSIPDLTLYGANAVVEQARADGATVTILPAGDVCKHGGVSRLAVVTQ